MWRKNAADPYGVSELKKFVSEILWVRTTVLACRRQYPEVLKSRGVATLVAQRFLDSPLQCFMKTESPDRDPTWLQSLPTAALRCFMKHALGLSQGLYRPEIQGALQKCPAEKFSVEKFHQTTRVDQRFTTAFLVAYDSLVGTPAGAKAAEGAEQQPSASSGTAASAGPAFLAKSESELEKTPELREMQVSAFRAECEQHCRQELEARLVALVIEGDHAEIKKHVTNTRLS